MRQRLNADMGISGPGGIGGCRGRPVGIACGLRMIGMYRRSASLGRGDGIGATADPCSDRGRRRRLGIGCFHLP